MPRVTKTVVTYICDRCGFSSEDKYARGGSADVEVSVGIRSYNGDVGGATTSDWYCGNCYEALLRFQRGEAVEAVVKETP